MADELKAIAPDGQLYDIPANKEADWLNRGPEYRIVSQMPGPKPSDFVNDGKEVSVIFKNHDPKSGEPGYGTIPADKVNAPEFNDHFTLFSQAEENGKRRERAEDATKKLDEFWKPGQMEITEKSHVYDKADITQDGKYKMQFESPDGAIQKVLVPPDNLHEYYANGANFQDSNYQALLDAYDKRIDDPQSEYFKHVIDSAMLGIPGYLNKRQTKDPSENNMFRAANLALARKEVEEPAFASAKKYGSLAAIPLSLAAGGTTGLFGEISAGAKLGKAAETAIVGAEGAGALRSAVGWTAGKALEGAVIASPQALAQGAIDKDLKGAAETLALGAGLNVGLAGLGKAIPAAIERIKTSTIDSALREAGATEETLTRLGTAEQKNTFIKTMEEMGLKEESSAANVSNVMKKISVGENLLPILTKLDPLMGQEARVADSLMTQIGDMVSKNTNKEVAPFIEKIGKDLQSLTDKSGNISLTNLQKFVANVTEGLEHVKSDNVTLFNKTIQNEGMKQLIELGDAAALKADTKTAAEWINAKGATELGGTMYSKLMDLKVPNSFSSNPIFKLIKGILKSKVSHLATGLVGGAIGHGAGPVGAIAGMGAGAVVHKAVERGFDLLEHYASNIGNTSQTTGWLAKKASSPAIASYLAMDAAHNLTKQIDKIPDFVRQMSVKTGTTFTSSQSPIKDILGDHANGLSKEQQFAKLSQNLSMMAGNPELRQQHLQAITAPFAKDHPEFAKGLQDEYNTKIQYLHQIMPKNPNPPKPFTKDDKWKPSAADITDFENQLKIAQNPFALLDKFKEGKVTAKEVATASVLNPAILNHMRDQINSMAFSGKVDLSYQQKLNASILMGTNMHASLDNVQALQSVYNTTQPEAPPQTGGSHKGGSHIKASAQSKETMSQRLMNK